MEGQGALVSAQGRVAWRVMSRSVIADRCRGFRASSRALAREIDAEPGAGRSTSRIAAANCRSARHVLSSARLDVLPARSWRGDGPDRKSTRLNSSHQIISYAVFCLKKKKKKEKFS